MSRRTPPAPPASPPPAPKRARASGADGVHAALLRASAICTSARSRLTRWSLLDVVERVASAESVLESGIAKLEALPADWRPPLARRPKLELAADMDVIVGVHRCRIIDVRGTIIMVADLDTDGDPDMSTVRLVSRKECLPCR